jgi:hypothetical protein
MRSARQRQASRENGCKGKGPTTQEGKNRSKFNGLKHGLRAEQVVLPGESAAEFKAELKGWADDWRPRGHTAAVLVERGAVASWRLRRCVRAERDLLLREHADGDHDGDRDEADDGGVDLVRAEARLDRCDENAAGELRSHPDGIDRLLERWDDIEAAIDQEYGWGRTDHEVVMTLLGRDRFDDPAAAGPTADASQRLAVANGCGEWEDQNLAFDDNGQRVLPAPQRRVDLDDYDAEAARLRQAISHDRAALRALRDDLLARAGGDLCDDQPDDDATFADVSQSLMLIHRYETAIERTLRATIKDLSALAKARPDLVSAADLETEVVVKEEVRESAPKKARPSSPRASRAPSEPEPGVVRDGPSQAEPASRGRAGAAAPPDRGESRS